jgi:phospholipid/cholesterol/gamma-HCH transport system substrate-binding protein
MASQLKNMLIGLFLVIGCFLIVGIILFIKPSVGDGKQLIKVRFTNINGIAIGTPVTYAGKPIGEVSSIQQVADAREQAINQYGQVYPYVLVLKVDSSYTIFNTDEITFQTQGLLGEKYVAIIPKPLKQGQVTHIITSKDVVYADASDLLETAMNELSNLSEKVEEVLNRVIVWIDKYGDSLGSAVKSFDTTITAAGKAITDFNNLEIIRDVKSAVANAASSLGQVDEALSELKKEAFFENLASTMNQFSKITGNISQGKGTLGRIVEDNGLYLQIDALMTKANTLMNDLNQYGLLFQYNKQWQRTRSKLMSEADQIRDPKAFQAYMNKEMDQMNTTLNRMNTLTNRFSPDKLAQNQKFRNDFAQLMQQLDSLQERVKLYNQELFDLKQRGG